LPKCFKDKELNEEKEFRKEIFEIYLEEYKTLRNEILSRIDFRQRVINYQLIFTGIISTLFLNYLKLDNLSDNNPDVTFVKLFLLLSPIFYYAFSWSFASHDIIIATLAKYINKELRPRIIKLCKISKNQNILGWDDYLNNDRERTFSSLGVLAYVACEALLPLILPVISLLIYILNFLKIDYNSFIVTSNTIMGEGKVLVQIILVLFLLDVLLLIPTIILKIYILKRYREISVHSS